MLEPRNKMDLHGEIPTADARESAHRQDAPVIIGAEPPIDLDRVIWDPEYRDQVLEDMRLTG